MPSSAAPACMRLRESQSLHWMRLAAAAGFALALAGCSDSARFSNGLFAAPSRSPVPASADVTGSVATRAPAGRVESQALPAPSRPATVAATGSASGGQGLGAYRPAGRSADITGSVSAPAHAPAHHAASGWTWEGGTPVTVGPNENIETVARKYGVPQSAIMQANNITDTAQVRPGRRLVIPRYIGTGAASASAAPQPAMAPRAAAPAASFAHTVEPGQTLLGISRRYGKSVEEVARLNNLKTYAKLNAGDRLMIPGSAPRQQAAAAPQIAQPRTVPAQPAATQAVASVEPPQSARLATTTAPAEAAATDSTKAAEAVGAIPSFRWPARGRVIAGYGAKLNGQSNDGINIAVPEGTPVKAAEDGTVAYAGNELKGYGNLVLIRHANGYVSAYAHASELLVKRGDTVKRGQIIGRSGQTGNVTSPQLHFEIRKGSTPVDPTQYLASNG